MQTVALIDYGSGNLHSARKALAKAAEDGGIAATIQVTREADEIASADRIVLPGVGALPTCMAALKARSGLIEALDEVVRGRGRPFLGICVGMQLLATGGDEHDGAEALGWVPGRVRALRAPGLKIPHMGWNEVDGDHPVLPPCGDAYFVHSYCFEPDAPSSVVATARYGEPFPAAIAEDNIMGVQFHPEKSQSFGLKLLQNFLSWDPS